VAYEDQDESLLYTNRKWGCRTEKVNWTRVKFYMKIGIRWRKYVTNRRKELWNGRKRLV